MSEPDFRQIESQMVAARALTDLPEAHGTLAGALCATDAVRLEDWLRELFADGRAGSAETALLAVFEWTRHVLAAGELEFQLLLPGDDESVERRAAALGEWCQGFLYGLGSSPIPDLEQLPEEVGEIVRDLTALTQVGIDADEPLEANEQAYAELVEFVRIGVQLLFDELARFRAEAADDGPRTALH
jgi:yecA family protein